MSSPKRSPAELILEEIGNKKVITNLARRKTLSPDILEAIYCKYKHLPSVRNALAHNPTTPIHILYALAEPETEVVLGDGRFTARMSLLTDERVLPFMATTILDNCGNDQTLIRAAITNPALKNRFPVEKYLSTATAATHLRILANHNIAIELVEELFKTSTSVQVRRSSGEILAAHPKYAHYPKEWLDEMFVNA